VDRGSFTVLGELSRLTGLILSTWCYPKAIAIRRDPEVGFAFCPAQDPEEESEKYESESICNRHDAPTNKVRPCKREIIVAQVAETVKISC
jgi:hypothetical protein